MRKTLIVYHSRTGFTRRYAQWLAQALDCPAVEFKDRNRQDFSLYGQLIWCDFFHAGGLMTLKWLKGQLPAWEDKRIAVLAVGACPPHTQDVEATLSRCLAGTDLPGFYVQGGLNYEQMGLGARLMMWAFRKMVKKKEGPNSETLQGVSHSFDAAAPAALTPIIHWAKDATP